MALIIVAGLFAAVQLVLWQTPPVEVSNKLGIMEKLPPKIGLLEAENILYCQNPQCGRSFRESVISKDADACSLCGSELGHMSPGEKNLFPEDTTVLRKLYSGMGGNAYLVTIVIAGKQRVSIHRPQICLRGQGYNVLDQESIQVGDGRESSFRASMLEIVEERVAGGGALLTQKQRTTRMLYWFVSAKRQTHSHYLRMFHTLIGRVIHGRVYRWAYISIVQSRATKNNMAELDDFAAELNWRIRPISACF